VLRSGDPAGLQQEMWALLALYQALRTAITDAVATVPGTDPDRASYQVAVETAQTLVTSNRNILTGASDLTGDIGRAVLASLHGPRRPRVCARRVKSRLSRWNKHPPGKPATCLRITSITTAIGQDHQPAPARRRQQPQASQLDGIRGDVQHLARCWGGLGGRGRLADRQRPGWQRNRGAGLNRVRSRVPRPAEVISNRAGGRVAARYDCRPGVSWPDVECLGDRAGAVPDRDS
jgi:hypothetical protein